MNTRMGLVVLMATLAAFARIAGAEMRLDVDDELRRAEELRLDEEQRRQQVNPSKMRIQVDSEENLRLIERGVRPPMFIPDAQYRVAVFTFEDPDKTGLGNALAGLVGREILMRSNVGSIGVLRYEGSLAPSVAQPLSYFDKVEILVDAQEVTLAVWGMVRRTGDMASIDIYAQLPPRVIEESFSWSLRMPAAMGGQSLVAHLRPARILVQSHQIQWSEAESLPVAAKALDTLRAAPRDDAAIVATLPVGSLYWVSRSQGDWSEISTGASKGWVRTAGHCVGGCAPLLDAARFSAGLLQFIQSRRVPEVTPKLAPDAATVRDQISALELLETARPGQFEAGVLRPLARWPAAGPDSQPRLPAARRSRISALSPKRPRVCRPRCLAPTNPSRPDSMR